jgi:hypothetical protein
MRFSEQTKSGFVLRMTFVCLCLIFGVFLIGAYFNLYFPVQRYSDPDVIAVRSVPLRRFIGGVHLSDRAFLKIGDKVIDNPTYSYPYYAEADSGNWIVYSTTRGFRRLLAVFDRRSKVRREFDVSNTTYFGDSINSVEYADIIYKTNENKLVVVSGTVLRLRPFGLKLLCPDTAIFDLSKESVTLFTNMYHSSTNKSH